MLMEEELVMVMDLRGQEEMVDAAVQQLMEVVLLV
jgi:hypothetical protein